MVTTFTIISLWGFSSDSEAAYSAVLGPIWPNFELVQDGMDILLTCKYEEDPIKMKALECSQHFPHYTLMGAIRTMETRVPIRSGPKHNAALPPPQ